MGAWQSAFPAVPRERLKRREQTGAAPSGPCGSHVPHGSARCKPGWEVGSRRWVPQGSLPGHLGSPTELLKMQIPRLSHRTPTCRSRRGALGSGVGGFQCTAGFGIIRLNFLGGRNPRKVRLKVISQYLLRDS